MAEIIDAGEAVIGEQTRRPQPAQHSRAEGSDQRRLEPGQPFPPELPQRLAGVANVGTSVHRQALNKFDQCLADPGELVNVKMSVDKVRCPSAFLEKNLVLRGDLPEELPRGNLARQRAPQANSVSGEMRLGVRSENRFG